MLRALRRKFIIIAMCSVGGVLAVILAVILSASYREIHIRADRLLAMLAENQGEFPDDMFVNGKRDENRPDARQGRPSFEEAQTDLLMPPPFPQEGETEGFRGGPEKPEEGYSFLVNGFTAETPYETRFFSVLLDEEGNALEVNTGNIAAVSDTQAVSYAAEIAAGRKKTGYFDTYRFLKTEETDGVRVIFVDCASNLLLFRRTVLMSLLVAGIGLVLVLALVLFFSRIVFRPVEESDRRQKQFITDASHELKTPLTIIDANTEVLEMIGEENEWTRSIRKQVSRLSAMVQQMVTLTRMDEGLKGERTEFSLSGAVTETAEPFEVLAETKGKKLLLQVQEGLTLRGDEQAVRQLVSILLDNAVKYSDEEGTIKLSVSAKGRKCVLAVENPAAGMEPGNQDVLFERFYRRDVSRNSETGGSGIGLSIAKAITEAHSGKIHAQSEDGRQLTVTVELPAAVPSMGRKNR